MVVAVWVPLLSELSEEDPFIEEEESLPPTPPFTLAEATPGTPALIEPPAFQLSLCPELFELLVPWLSELPSELPLVLEAILLMEELSVWAEPVVWEMLPPLIVLSVCDWLAVCDQLSEWLWLLV
jgi:hypothetical protein